jgi:hypothetical protein
MPRNGPPRPGVVEAPGIIRENIGKITNANITDLVIFPELWLSVGGDFRIYENGNIEITNEAIVKDIGKRYLHAAPKKLLRRLLDNFWPKKHSTLSENEQKSGMKAIELRRAICRFHSKYTRPSMTPVESKIPLSEASMVQLPEAIISAKDLDWGETGKLSIKGSAAKKLIVESILYLPRKHVPNHEPAEWVLPATRKELDVSNGCQNIILNHIRSGRWIWITQENGDIDVELTEDLEVSRAMSRIGDTGYLARLRIGPTPIRERPRTYAPPDGPTIPIIYKQWRFLRVLLYEAHLAAEREEISTTDLSRKVPSYLMPAYSAAKV